MGVPRLLGKVLRGISGDDICSLIEANDPVILERINSVVKELSAPELALIQSAYEKSYDDLSAVIADGEFPVPPPFATQLALLGKLTLAPSTEDMPDIVTAFSDELTADDHAIYGQMLDRWLNENGERKDRIAEAVRMMRQLCATRSIGDLAPRLLVRCLHEKQWEPFDAEEEAFITRPDPSTDMQAFVAEYGAWLRTKGYAAMADRLVEAWEGELPEARRRVA
jgi:hypothetical protein